MLFYNLHQSGQLCGYPGILFISVLGRVHLDSGSLPVQKLFLFLSKSARSLEKAAAQ